MRGRRSQFGFSLIEVLFAVLVLTLGLVFVASQFPIALSQSYDIAQTTTNPIFARNVAIQTELQMNQLVNAIPSFTAANEYFNSVTDINGDQLGEVHFLSSPNYRINIPDMVMDDPLNIVFNTIPPNTFFEYPKPVAATPAFNELPPFVDYFDVGGNQGQIGRGNLGLRVSPQVSYYDPKVIDNMYLKYNLVPPFDTTVLLTWQRWNNEVYEVAKGRKFCQCVFYQCLDPSAAGGRNFRFLIFTIKLLENQRYALQDNSFTYWALQPKEYPAAQDRWLPVPWYVELKWPIIPYDRNRFSTQSLDTIYFNESDNGSGVNNYSDSGLPITKLLRPGSKIISITGEIYEIQEAYGDILNPIFGLKLRQKMPITDPALALQYFWVIPPPLTPNGDFGENQLVVDVSEKIVRF